MHLKRTYALPYAFEENTIFFDFIYLFVLFFVVKLKPIFHLS